MSENSRAAHKDYYYVLGLNSSASQGQVQAAYNELYDKFGPHVSAEELDPDSMARAYRDISEAFEVLRDPRTRAEYDKKAIAQKQISNDLRDLWLKKSGFDAAAAAASQAAEEHNPSSWIKRTTGSHPVYEDEKSQSVSSARNPALIRPPVASAIRFLIRPPAVSEIPFLTRLQAANEILSLIRQPAVNAIRFTTRVPINSMIRATPPLAVVTTTTRRKATGLDQVKTMAQMVFRAMAITLQVLLKIILQSPPVIRRNTR